MRTTLGERHRGQMTPIPASPNVSTSKPGGPHGRVRLGRMLTAVVAVAAVGLLGACGGGDSTDESGAADDATETASSEDSGAAVPEPTEVAACLADAGYETELSSEMLSEAQMADQLELFGETEALTFDAATTSFAGGVSFYETEEQANERAEKLGDVAKAQRVVGAALINVAAGSDFDDAVAQAETCLLG